MVIDSSPFALLFLSNSMKRSASESCLFLFKALSLYGLMAGLLFSCGEGIRLFPFPVDRVGVASSIRTDDGQRIQYEENIPRLVDRREKDERDLGNVSGHHTSLLAGTDSSLSDVARSGNALAGLSERSFPNSLLFASRLRGRAPPVI